VRRTPGHGTRSGYARHRRLGEEACASCKRAQAIGLREANERQRARWLSEGKVASTGSPRSTPYDARGLALMAKYGLEPDPRFVWSPP
jgi:hypothetical protein